MRDAIFNFEVKRKIFHLYSIILPLTYMVTPKLWMVVGLLIIALGILYIDVSRHYNTKIKELTGRFFSQLMRPEEENGTFRLSGVSYMMAGFFLTALLFSKGLAITSWLILIISDCIAALTGLKIGTPLSNGKSIEGSIAFFSSAVLISMLCYFFIGYRTSFSILILTCAITTILEFFSKELKINDNLIIPLSYGFFTTSLSFIAGL